MYFIEYQYCLKGWLKLIAKITVSRLVQDHSESINIRHDPTIPTSLMITMIKNP